MTEEQLKEILSKAQVPYINQFKIINSNDLNGSKRENNRYTILDFETDEIARQAVDIIQSLNVKTGSGKRQIRFQACMFVPDFKSKIEQGACIIVFNLPGEIKYSDVYELFSSFGNVLTIQLMKQDKGKLQQKENKEQQQAADAKILFSTKQEAQEAIQQVNGKYLGKNQVFVKEFYTVQQRIENNADIMIQDCPEDITSADIIQGLSKLGFENFLDEQAQEMFISQPIDTFDGQVRFAIFTCKDKETADQIINRCKQEKLVIKVKEVKVNQKLTKGMISYLEAIDRYEQVKIEEQRNILVYGVAYKQVKSQDVFNFFSRYGQIECMILPEVKDQYNFDTAYFNIQYKTKEEAKNALQHATEDEQKEQKRLSRTLLRLECYNNMQ